MGDNWSKSPWWLRTWGVVGIPWFLVWFAVGVPLLFTEGPGLAVMLIGLLGVAPWVIMGTNVTSSDSKRP